MAKNNTPVKARHRADTIAAKGGVNRDLPADETMSGFPGSATVAKAARPSVKAIPPGGPWPW